MTALTVRRFEGLSRRSVLGHAKADAPKVRRAAVVVREAGGGDIDAIRALIDSHVAEGHLLPRTREEIAAHASRFVVASDGERIIGCADIAPLSAAVGEIRSLVIGEEARGLGIGRGLLDELVARAHRAGFRTLCAFTSAPGFFVQRGFSIVPHSWLPEKIQADCHACARFRSCGQYALLLTLGQRLGQTPRREGAQACHR